VHLTCANVYLFQTMLDRIIIYASASRYIHTSVHTHLEARAAALAGVVDGRASRGDHGRKGRLVDGTLVPACATYVYHQVDR